ncbi:MAG: hypothetical protein WDN48_08900 [Pseudolabrys sp.]
MLTREVLKSYLLDMPSGHIFDLTYKLFADVFPPGEPDAAAREKLRALAEECNYGVVNNETEGRFELTRR